MNRRHTFGAESEAGGEPGVSGVDKRRLRTADLLGGAVVATVVGLHLLDLSEEFATAPYLGAAYIAVIAGFVLSIGLLVQHDQRGWMLGGAICLVTLMAAVGGRISGLDDIGSWNKTAGTCSIIAEAAVVALAISHFRSARRPAPVTDADGPARPSAALRGQ